MHVAVVHNAPLAEEAADRDLVLQAESIRTLIAVEGHATSIFAVEDVGSLVEFLKTGRPDLIFNCCESFRGVAALEMNVAALFDLLSIPYTGSPALTLGIGLNKAFSKAVFRASKVRTPDFSVCTVDGLTEAIAAAARLPYPRIVKPVAEDASIGIDDGAVVQNETEMRQRVRWVNDRFGTAAIVEEFIDGPEFNVGVLAESAQAFITLPPVEILFSEFPAGAPHILSYEAKWNPDSEAYRRTKSRCPAEIDPPLARTLSEMALRAARAIGMRDYGRVDLRVRSSDKLVFVLEANPNPQLTADSDFVLAAGVGGRSYPWLIREILERAIERSGPASECPPHQ